MKTLFKEFEGCDGIIYLETDLTDQVDDEEGLDICRSATFFFSGTTYF